MATIGSALLAQGLWLLTAAGAAAGHWWIGPVAVAVAAFWRLADARRRPAVLRAVLAAVAAGAVGDGLLAAAGVLRFPGGAAVLVPLWMLGLWVNFALVLEALAWLRPRPWLAALVGAAGGPLSYRFGETFGVIVLGPTVTLAAAAIAVEWALALPLLLWVTEPQRNARRQLVSREVAL